MTPKPKLLSNEQARLIFQSELTSASTHFVVVVFLYSLMSSSIDTQLLAVWTITTSLVVSMRFTLVKFYTYKQPDNVLPWLNAFTVLTLMLGLCWASFTLFYLLVDNVGLGLVFIAVSCSVMAGASIILAVWTPAYYANTVPQFIALSFVLLTSNEQDSYYLAAALLMFYAMLSSSQRHGSEKIKDNLLLQQKNEALIADLTKEVGQREQVIAEKTQEIKDSEHRFQILLENVPAISVQGYNEQREVIFWNSASEKMYGYTEQEALGRMLDDLIIPPNMKQVVVDAHGAWLNKGIGIPTSELTLVGKNGSNVDVFSSHVLLTNKAGEKEMFCIDIDLSELKKAEKELEKSNEKFQTIFEQAPLGVALIDSYTGDIYDANPAYVSIVGRSIEELRTLDWMEITHPDDIQEDLGNMAAMNAGKTSGFAMQKRYIQPDGAVRWINMTIAPIQVGDENKPRHLCMIEDISENKKVSLALQHSEENIRKSQCQLLNVINGAHLGYWDWDYKTGEHVVNDRWLSMLGLTQQNTENNISDWESRIHPDDKEKIVKATQASIDSGDSYVSEFRMRHANGHWVWIQGSGGVVEYDGASHDPIRLCGTYQDITERKKSEEKVQLLARVFSDTHEGIIITNVDKLIIDVNPAFCEITGYSWEDVIGQNPRILSSGKQGPVFYQNMWQQVEEQGHWQGEVWNRKKGGEIYAELLTISVLKDVDDNVVNYVGAFSDITTSKRQQEELSLMAHYDVLTGLPNRALFTDRFTQAIAHSKRSGHQLAICFLDLDNFKPVNDNYGHEVGDQLLIEVAERITANIREEDTVSRQGGDEFALLLNDIESFAQCEQTLQRIHYTLAQPFLIDDVAHKITASSGVTLYPNDEADIDTLLRHADQAMYQAKLKGKHRYHLFNPEHDQRTIEKHHQLDEIEQALANNEFQLYYQPKVNMVTGKVFGAEALIRWIHPEKGLIPPLDFLPLIDNTELEIKVGNWVINQALSQLSGWHQQGIQIEVSINIASHHLLSETFFAELESALVKHPSVDPQCLQLEILESSALGDLNAISTVIEICQGALGVKVALDDFGTGYSSLTHLRSLPVNTIKIDQSFVRDMLDDPSDYAIIDGIIGLSDSFNREVIAEGVETTKHGIMLLMMGCDEAQGYGISRPLPADDFPQWLEAYTPNKEWQLCGNKHRSIKESKVKLFRLITDHWKDTFINNIQSPPADVERWPIMNSKHCPCGTWIKRAKQEQLFEGEGLNKLDKTHEALHLVAQALHLQYQEGDVDAARKGLPELQAAFDDMSYVLDMCE